ncbi:MAG TPA: hypothetical protein VOA78_15350 [Candidatus Dormibacteraeota bacterium]|nr:hypothetical protein [Candidatus Dormibacteraeota bacterium]
MGSNFPALDVRPPENPLDQFAKVSQIRSLLLGQQLNAANLQGKNIDNQERQMQLAVQSAVVRAQHDPDWDATDPDKVVKILSKYSVPIQAQSSVMKGISEIRTSLYNSSKENLDISQRAQDYLDDQFEAAKAAPSEVQQSTYQKAISNATAYANSLPNGPARAMFLQRIGTAPPMYDEQFINTEHALLRTGKDLTEEALEKAKIREASGKGYEAEQAGNLTAAKIPGAQAESTIEGQNAALTPQGRALAGNLFYQSAGGNTQATGALAQETAQKVATAQAGVQNVPDALKGVAPHLVQPAAAAAEKAGNEYGDAMAAARDMKTFVDLAKTGNKIAYAYSPTEGVLTLNTSRGVKRVNMPEIHSYSGAGSAADRVEAFFGKNISGASIPDDVLNDMASLHQAIGANAKQTYAGKLRNTNSTYGSHFQPVDMGGGTVRMKAPNGQIKDVDPSDVEHYKSMGATVVP